MRHLLVGVSPAALGGDGHDPQSTAVRRLVDAARDWAEQEFGGVFACRCDVDERGQGVVDVLIAPVREMVCGRAKAPRPKVLPTRALREFAVRNGGRTVFDSYRLMQDSWAAFARGRGYDVVRGDPKIETAREHLSPEQYGAAVDGAANYAAHQTAIAKSIERRTRKLAKAMAKQKRRERRAEARLGAAQAAERQAAAARREAAEAGRAVADRAAEVEARAEAVEAKAEEARRLSVEAAWWRGFVLRIAKALGDGDQRRGQRQLAEWLHRCEAAGGRPDAELIVTDLDRLADGRLTADEVQRYTEEIEFELDKKPVRPTTWRGPRGP